MNLADFRHLLDAHGADPARWPAAAREGAEKLVATDAAAQAALSQARSLDDLIRSGLDVADVTPTRIMTALAGSLPPQRRGWWPVELLAVDFSPAWPRLAALAGVAALGFAIGFADLAVPTGRPLVTASADSDLSTILFDPDPLPRMRPR